MFQHFFGLVRGVGGGSSRANAIQFAQLVKLLSLYSLVKPPRGSNVSGAEMLDSLLKCNDEVAMQSVDERKKLLEEQLDKIIDDGEHMDFIPYVLCGQDYIDSSDDLNSFAVCYIAGYVARKARTYCRDCPECRESLTSQEEGEHTRLIELKSKGYLLYPSPSLENLVQCLEKSVQSVVTNHKMCAAYVFLLTEEVMKTGISSFIGCQNLEHQKNLTKRVVKFFLLTRMHFLCKTECQANERARKLEKLAKLAKPCTSNKRQVIT